MIPVLTIYLLRKLGFKVDLDAIKGKFKEFLINLKTIFWIFPILLTFYSFTEISKPEKVDKLSFEIYRKSNQIGKIEVEKQLYKDRTRYEISTSIDTRVLLKIQVEAKEISEFVDGVLTYSSVFRKVNNKVKSDHKVVLDNGTYKMISDGDEEELDIDKIYQNLVTLYFQEPDTLHNVYCDNDGALAEIIKIKPNTYRVEISPGKFNIYHYQNGKCVSIEAHNSIFSVKLIAQ